MAKVYTRAELEAMTDKGLKSLCIHTLGIHGVSKKLKHEVVNTILSNQRKSGATAGATVAKTAEPIKGVEFSGHSVMTKPGAPFGKKTSTTIQVSCGASSGTFPLAGRTVKEVGEFLREVLNVDKLSTGLVNGKEAGADYQLKPGDALEFLKPAGKKG